MAYTTNLHMGKVRRDAVRLVKYKGWSMRKAGAGSAVAVRIVSNRRRAHINDILLST